MSCTNCFNGCAETVSDQCVKYTGIDVPALGISNGDSLLSVEQAIISFLVPAINGTGIKPIIDDSYICTVVRQYLPACTECTGFTLNEVLTAIIRAACDLQTQVTTNTNAITALNANYTIGCLTGVTASSDTHDIVQAVINNLCNLNSAFTTLLLTLPLTYVSIANIDTYIAAYLTSQNFLAKAKDRMIPYAAIPYFGPLSNYPSPGDTLSVTGAGTGYWEKVYLCNGDNATPDLRGRTVVGVTGMGVGVLDPEVNPSTPGNPNYLVTTEYGANTVTLGLGQVPNHNHLGSSATSVDSGHYHLNVAYGNEEGLGTVGTSILNSKDYNNSSDYALYGSTSDPTTGQTGIGNSIITTTLNIVSNGGGGSHNNVQPSRGAYYIIYIP
jgi:microcystin-dependent protein